MRARAKRLNAKRFVVVLVTCPSPAVARRLAAALVRRRLAACVNVLRDVESTFWWSGKTQRSREALLIIKTTSGHFQQLRQAIVKLHPYQVPEIIALGISAGYPPYLNWLAQSVSTR